MESMKEYRTAWSAIDRYLEGPDGPYGDGDDVVMEVLNQVISVEVFGELGKEILPYVAQGDFGTVKEIVLRFLEDQGMFRLPVWGQNVDKDFLDDWKYQGEAFRGGFVKGFRVGRE